MFYHGWTIPLSLACSIVGIDRLKDCGVYDDTENRWYIHPGLFMAFVDGMELSDFDLASLEAVKTMFLSYRDSTVNKMIDTCEKRWRAKWLQLLGWLNRVIREISTIEGSDR